LENVLIENGLKAALSSPSQQIYFSVHCHKPRSPPSSAPILPLNDVAEELEDNRNKGDEKGYTSGNEQNKPSEKKDRM
jgi:hypothetical protein